MTTKTTKTTTSEQIVGNAGQLRITRKIGSRTFSIRSNAYSNWYGYIGSKRVEMFFNSSTATQEQNARAWLDEQVRLYSK